MTTQELFQYIAEGNTVFTLKKKLQKRKSFIISTV